MKPSDVLDETDLVVDNTILSDMVCSTRGAMRHVLGLGTKGEAAQLRAGSAIHEALAWWLCGQPVEKALGRFDENYREWAKTNVPGDDQKRLGWKPLKAILRHWFKTHPLEEWQFVVKAEEVEVALVAELGTIKGEHVVMVALLDAMGKNRRGGRWSIDHKTTAKRFEQFKQEQEDSSQFTGQLWIAKQNGMELSGVFINRIEVREVPGSTRRCSNHGTTYEECGQQHLDHRLFPITRTPHEIEIWELTARKLVAKYIRLRNTVESVEDVRGLPMEGRFFRACTYCEFREWCRVGRPLGAVPTFVENRWNPLERAKEQAEAVAEARGS